MLTIRLQRTGRSGSAMFRVVVQDSRQTPTSGKVVTLLGSYDPHAKTLAVDKEKAAYYLEHGAQPSPRAARLLQADGVKLPKWASTEGGKQGKIRNADKLRRNRPPEAVTTEPEVKAESATAEPTEATAESKELAAEAASEAPAEEAAESTDKA